MKNLGLLFILFFACSCASQKNFVYFQPEVEAVKLVNQSIKNEPEVKIRRDDMLAIVATSIDGLAANPYNLVRTDVNAGALPITNFLVSETGDIDYPGLGKVKLEGLSIAQAKEKIKGLLSPYLKDAVINVRLVNFKVTVLGEVRSPSSFAISEEKISILEALGLAGDITDFGDRKNIVVIRETSEDREFGHLNILSEDIFKSEFFYLMQNDVIYVPPNKHKALSVKTEPLRQIVLPVLGVMISLSTLIILTNR